MTYSDTSSGIGTGATIDIVVGQGSSIIDFSINCTGSGYREDQILTIPYGGTTGIQTDTSTYYNEFQLTVTEQFSDKFSGWSIGELEREMIERTLDKFRGNRRKTAQILDISERTLYRKINEYGNRRSKYNFKQ